MTVHRAFVYSLAQVIVRRRRRVVYPLMPTTVSQWGAEETRFRMNLCVSPPGYDYNRSRFNQSTNARRSLTNIHATHNNLETVHTRAASKQ